MLWGGLLGAAIYGTALLIGLLGAMSATPTLVDGLCAVLLSMGLLGSLLVSSAVLEEDEVAVRVRLQWGLALGANPLLQLATLWGVGAV